MRSQPNSIITWDAWGMQILNYLPDLLNQNSGDRAQQLCFNMASGLCSWAVKSGHQWSSCYISTVLSYCRVFQQQPYWHFGLASPLLWGAVLRIVECKRHPRIGAASFASTHWMTAATPHPGMTIPNVYSNCHMPHGGGKIAPGWEMLSREMLQNVEEEYMERFFLIYQFHLY